jgi:hypothetical protein
VLSTVCPIRQPAREFPLRAARHTSLRWWRSAALLIAAAACTGAAEPGLQNAAPANLERKKEISDQSAKLLQLAAELKAEVDKTSKDTLSLGVIRKADEIEKLAHNEKGKTRPTAGGS